MIFNKLRILITGGAGFIGHHLVRGLLEEERIYSVTVMDNLSTGKMINVHRYEDHPKYHFTEGDIRDYEWCLQMAEGMDVIIHLAALGSVPRSIKDPVSTHEVNLSGSLNVLKAAVARKVPRVIMASSSSVYGDLMNLPQREEKTGNPLSPYAVSKKGMEDYTRVFHKTYGLEYIIFRYFNVFGPGQDAHNPYAAVMPLFCKAFAREERPVIYGDGQTSRDFTYIENLISANKLAIFNSDEKAWNQTYNIACGNSVSLLDAIQILQRESGKNLLPIFQAERQGDIRHSRACIDRAEKLLGYRPLVHFEEGLIKLISS
ncbi:MAG: NAD-dependent epimerase/dehydratase family protein [Saprospirales bacterium]|nr:MAG: NAD-dependent epimerase/dehydratase family protein [Saprospirales bacterium]